MTKQMTLIFDNENKAIEENEVIEEEVECIEDANDIKLRLIDCSVQVDKTNRKPNVLTHNMFTNTEQSGAEGDETNPFAAVGHNPNPGSDNSLSPKRGRFNKLFNYKNEANANKIQPQRSGSPKQAGEEPGVFRISFNKGNLKITPKDLTECTKPLEDFVDENIERIVDENCTTNSQL